MTAWTPGTAQAHLGQGVDQCLEALLVLDPSPGDDERLVAPAAVVGRSSAPVVRSTPFGTTLTLSAGSSEARRPPRRMKLEQQMTWRGLVREPPLDAVDGRRLARRQVPPPRPRSVAWMRGDEGAPQLTCSVLPAHATSQSWACTTSGRQPSRRAAAVTRWLAGAGHVGDEVVVGEPGQLGLGPDHPHPVDDRVLRGVGWCSVRTTTSRPAPGQGSGQAVRMGRDAADRPAVGTPRQHGHCTAWPT